MPAVRAAPPTAALGRPENDIKPALNVPAVAAATGELSAVVDISQ